MAKNRQIAENLVLLRMAVGAAGEDKNLAWWRSAFCGSMSGACLAPVFPKTVALAALTGVTAAACRVHDEHIGVGRVFHLFRLPEDLERAICEVLPKIPASRVTEVKSSLTAAQSCLRAFADGVNAQAEGPVAVGKSDEITHPSVWKKVAAMYLHAIQAGIQAYPYFVEK